MRMRKTLGLSLVLLVVSTAAMAREIRASHDHPVSSVKSKLAHARLAKIHRKRRRVGREAARRTERQHAVRRLARRRPEVRRTFQRRLVRHHIARQEAAALPPPDQYLGPVKPIGKPEIGEAAWYGGGMVGRRTASGERLDRVHVTAAHRWLPMYSLVKVTNLRNGRSVIATINDRGPVSHRLLIDLSPRAARALHMVHSGVAKVAVVPVAVGARAGSKRQVR